MPTPHLAEPLAREARPLRDGIPSAVWRGFDRAVAKAHGPIRGAFRRSTDILRSAFTLDEARDSLQLIRDLESLISTPSAVERWRPATEELLDLYLGPRERLPQETSAGVRILDPWNADRVEPGKAIVARVMTDAGKVAVLTSEPLDIEWWDRRRMLEEMVRWASQNAAARVTLIDDATRAGIREIVLEAFDPGGGLDRDGIARALRALDGSDGRLRLGLDAPRQRSLMKFIDSLPARMPRGRRQRLIDRRFNQLLRARAQTIAITEAATIGNRGQIITLEQAAADGELDAALYLLEWVARAINVCPRCQAFDRSTREIEGGEFISDGTGPRGVERSSGPTLHVRCMCVTRSIRRQDSEKPPGAESDAQVLARPSSAYPEAKRSRRHTLERFTRPDGTLTPERARLHRAITNHFLRGLRAVDEPRFTMMGGGPSSGKGSMLKQLDIPKNTAMLDVDEVRALLPEMREGIAAGDAGIAAVTHKESSLLTQRILAEAGRRHFNILLDGTGDGSMKKLRGRISTYRRYSSRLSGQYVTVDTDEAVRRMILRGEATGRYVPEDYMRRTHADLSRIIPDALEAGLYDDFTLWDNNGPFGSKPFKVAEYRNGRLKILDQEAWEKFLAKA